MKWLITFLPKIHQYNVLSPPPVSQMNKVHLGTVQKFIKTSQNYCDSIASSPNNTILMLGLSHLYLQFVKQKRFFHPCFPSALAGYFPNGTYLQVIFMSKEFKVFLQTLPETQKT